MTKEQWKAIKTKDANYDGRFFYAVKTRKTICRPSCPTKTTDSKNIIIFNTLEEGLAAGFHPCSRCRPELPQWQGAKPELVKRAKKYIDEHYAEKFSLDKIADALFINKIYLSKTFKEVTGTTPLKYHNKVRVNHAAMLLKNSDDNVQTIGSKVGFSTPSHFTRIFRSVYQCTPSEYRKNYLDSLDLPDSPDGPQSLG